MPQPMVIILSAQSANSCVSNLGRWASRLIPRSAMTYTATGFTRSPGSVPAERASALPVGKLTEKRLRHLTAPGIVHADEENPFQSRLLP